jgi:hypothetical protein
MEGLGASEEELRKRALRRLRKKRDFRTHLFMYVLVNLGLVAIWALSDGGFFWPIFVILGWGIGVVAQAWDVYFRHEITEDEIQREAQRLRERS